MECFGLLLPGWSQTSWISTCRTKITFKHQCISCSPLGSYKPPWDLPLWVFCRATEPQPGSSLPKHCSIYRGSFGCLDCIPWTSNLASYIGWPALCAGIRKKPACTGLDDRVMRSVGCCAVFFSIHCKTKFASVLLPDSLWMVSGHLVVNVTRPENFSRFN